MQKLLRFASLYRKAATAGSAHTWAAGIVNEAFQQVMGRSPSPAELQIVLAVSNLESSYGRGWKGQGSGSHNWGAVQTSSKTSPQFQNKDSSAEGSYVTGFKVYPDDVAGAADVVKLLFKSSRKQQLPDPKHAQRARGGEIPGPGRGELIQIAAQQGDTLAFSKAMWYTTYFEGTSPEFTQRIKSHANGIQNRINTIAAAIGQSPAWSIKSTNYLPVTNDQTVIQKIVQMNPKASEGMQVQPAAPLNTPLNMPGNAALPEMQQDLGAVENILWFQ